MRSILLGSLCVPNKDLIESALGTPLQELRVGVIPNARDKQERGQSLIAQQKRRQLLGKYGIATEIIDLRDFNHSTQVAACLGKFQGLYVMGGSSFVLRQAMQTCGFDEVIVNENLLYIGESAGAAIAGRSLLGLELVDPPVDTVVSTYDGLGLVDKVVVPHASWKSCTAFVTHMQATHGIDNLLLLNDREFVLITT